MAKITFTGPEFTGKYMGGVIQKNASGFFFRSLGQRSKIFPPGHIIVRQCLKQAAQLYKSLSPSLKSSWYNAAQTFYPRKVGAPGLVYNGANCYIGYTSFVLFSLHCGQNIPFYTSGGIDYPFTTLNFALTNIPPHSPFIHRSRIYYTYGDWDLLLNSVTWNGSPNSVISFGLVPDLDISAYAPPYKPQWYDLNSENWFGYALFCSEPLPAQYATPSNPLQHLIGITRPIYYAQGAFPNPSDFPLFIKVLPQTNFTNCNNPYKSGDYVRYTLFPVSQNGRSNGFSFIEGRIA